ncbi:MAG: hypothetical protein KKA81_15390 [Bacteroidetes bacterium]|nr:hypothetical protein [Bacteroidota bacterium]
MKQKRSKTSRANGKTEPGDPEKREMMEKELETIRLKLESQSMAIKKILKHLIPKNNS